MRLLLKAVGDLASRVLLLLGMGREKLAAGTERQTKCLLQSRRALKMA